MAQHIRVLDTPPTIAIYFAIFYPRHKFVIRIHSSIFCILFFPEKSIIFKKLNLLEVLLESLGVPSVKLKGWTSPNRKNALDSRIFPQKAGQPLQFSQPEMKLKVHAPGC